MAVVVYGAGVAPESLAQSGERAEITPYLKVYSGSLSLKSTEVEGGAGDQTASHDSSLLLVRAGGDFGGGGHGLEGRIAYETSDSQNEQIELETLGAVHYCFRLDPRRLFVEFLAGVSGVQAQESQISQDPVFDPSYGVSAGARVLGISFGLEYMVYSEEPEITTTTGGIRLTF